MSEEILDLTIKQIIGELLSNDDVDTAIRNMVGDFMGEFIESLRISVTDFRGQTWHVGREA